MTIQMDEKILSSSSEKPTKFSLYLSTMLMYGTVKIYNLQIKMLLGKKIYHGWQN